MARTWTCPECGAPDGAEFARSPGEIGDMIKALERVSDGGATYQAAVGALEWVLTDPAEASATTPLPGLLLGAQRPHGGA